MQWSVNTNINGPIEINEHSSYSTIRLAEHSLESLDEFIFKLAPPDALPSSAVTQWVSHLQHEAWQTQQHRTAQRQEDVKWKVGQGADMAEFNTFDHSMNDGVVVVAVTSVRLVILEVSNYRVLNDKSTDTAQQPTHTQLQSKYTMQAWNTVTEVNERETMKSFHPIDTYREVLHSARTLIREQF